MSTEVPAHVREVAGYRVRQRIGAGGYGEVWIADAPGGLQKAVKFVYGFHDEARAARELKALYRIRSVRHPFLLSLERVEVIEGQLVIVTELADKSLKDRFEECRTAGLPGVPRAELLRYLCDSAEGLDYMSEQHSLQHLDVKPENLLIVGDHSKVADFGLVKHLQDVTASMMAGLTPVYAAPEVFHDQPSKQSDQYSLAIVFQEMLTGALPFPGKTPAQLTAQHLSSRPRLNSLPEADRPIIDRALAKDPAQRYRSCRELLQALVAASDPSSNLPASGVSVPLETTNTDTKTICASDTRTTEPTDEETSCEQSATMDMSAPEPSPLNHQLWDHLPELQPTRKGPAAWNAAESKHRPTLVVGVGGIGVRLAYSIEQKYRDSGKEQGQAWYRALAVDTDSRTLNSMEIPPPLPEATDITRVLIPLRRPQSYRSESARIMQSVSRRWLYNIPNSLATEGLRPLGRIAYLDHIDTILQQIGDAIDDVGEQAQLTPNAVAGDPRVIVLASINGGAGSGIVLDLAFAICNLLQKRGQDLSDLEVMLVHASPRKTDEQDLARSNALACLTELHQVLASQKYPGDPSARVPEIDLRGVRRPIFQLLHWGDELNEGDYDRQIDELSDYLLMRARSRSGCYLDNLNAECSQNEGGVPTVNTFSTYTVPLSSRSATERYSCEIASAVVQRWLGGEELSGGDRRRMAMLNKQDEEGEERQNRFERILQQHVEQLVSDENLSLDPLLQTMFVMVHNELGADPDEYFRAILSQEFKQLDQPCDDPLQRSLKVFEFLDQVIGQGAAEMESTEKRGVSLRSEISPKLRGHGEETAHRVIAWLLSHLDQEEFRLQRTRELQHAVDDYFRQLEDKARAMAERLQGEVYRHRQKLLDANFDGKDARSRDRAKNAASDYEAWIKYAHLRTHGVALLGVCQFAQVLRAKLLDTNLALKTVEGELRRLANFFDLEIGAASDTSIRAVEPRFHEFLLVADREARARICEEYHGLQNLLVCTRDGAMKGAKMLENICRTVIIRAQTDLSQSVSPVSLTGAPPRDEIARALTDCRPRLASLGGACAVSVFFPCSNIGESEVGKLPTAEGAAGLVPCDVPEVVYCQHVEGTPLRDAARMLVDNRPEYRDIAARLHGRIDVNWREL
ncbi:protein kinase [Blastopirellula sp. JC732]|uniref:Protein kinase n=1 Tax=Blastopirellula sediminis TaxID=2894196 RepID=A0A9X1MRN3_9BACT|nr:tubulin-like doman-containing protein [Blastopirellula sediminis]MCC9604578.1 protein kinase [Blastopirellula sediminis]MCC9632123.1 protein kinase [Blastopirellula sediminis]